MIHEICLELGAIDCAVETKVMTQLLSGRYIKHLRIRCGRRYRTIDKSCPTRGRGRDSTPPFKRGKTDSSVQSDGAEIRNTSLLWLNLHRTIIEQDRCQWRKVLGAIGEKTIRDTLLQSYRQPRCNDSRTTVRQKFPYCCLSLATDAGRQRGPQRFCHRLSRGSSADGACRGQCSRHHLFDSNQHDDLALVALSEEIGSDVIIGPLLRTARLVY